MIFWVLLGVYLGLALWVKNRDMSTSNGFLNDWGDDGGSGGDGGGLVVLWVVLGVLVVRFLVWCLLGV
jgi:hypothetical protein